MNARERAEWIDTLTDPAERAREAQKFISQASCACELVRAVRDAAIGEWRGRGVSQRTIAAELGVTPGLIGQIDSKRKGSG